MKYAGIIIKKDFLNFDFDMIRHIKSQMIQKIEMANTHHSDYIHLVFQDVGEFLTLESLIDSGFFSIESLKLLTETLFSLQNLCDEYLLDFDKIDFHPKNIYYDANHKSYIYRYLPFEHQLYHHSLKDLLLRLGVENFQLFTSTKGVDWLKHSELSLEQFHDNLHRIKYEAATKKNPFSFMIKRFKPHSEPVQIAMTQHRKHLPTLTNKLNPEEIHTLYFDFSTVGRSASSNIFLDCSTVSKSHAVIIKEDSTYHIQDLNSTNGTYLNGDVIHNKTQIVNGDLLQFGNKEFIFLR